MIFPKTKSLIFFRCSPFILFFEFSQIFFYIPSSHIFICAYLSYYIHVDYFLLIYLFPYIFININIGCGHSVNKKKKLVTSIQMTLHLQSCHTPLNAPQFSNLSVFCPLHIFTNHCVTSTFILHNPLLQQIFNVHSLNKKYWNSSKNAFRVIDWLNQDKYQFWFINNYKQGACETNFSLTFSKYFEHCSFSVFLDFFHFSSVHSFSPTFFPFLILFYSRSHSIHMGFCFSVWMLLFRS